MTKRMKAEGGRMKWWQRITLVFSLVVTCLAFRITVAQTTVDITVRLRAADGSPVVGERLQLIAFATESQQACQTDDEGICRWQVASGLYELLTDRSLDDLSRYAVAEGGLRGLGLTVGDAPITYTLTIQPDNHIYFDTAPDALIPQPFIPTAANTHLHGTPNVPSEITDASEISQTVVSTEVIPVATPTPASDATRESAFILHPSAFILLCGGAIGAVIALLAHRRRTGGRQSCLIPVATSPKPSTSCSTRSPKSCGR